MEKVKALLSLVPFGALALAATYLQGYWGTFNIFPFPYMSFTELLSYSAAPLFAFVISMLIGFSWGSLTALEQRRQGKVVKDTYKSNPIQLVYDAGMVAVCLALFYANYPVKWLAACLVGFNFFFRFMLRTAVIQTLPKWVVGISLAAIWILPTSYAYGRMRAVELVRSKDAEASIDLEGGKVTGLLLGRLGSNYFLFSATSERILVLPESTVKKIELNWKSDHSQAIQ